MERRSFQKETEFDHLLKIILIGDASVGKSSLLLRYIDDTFEENYICTIGVDFKIKTIEQNGKRLKLQIWDTAGQERFRPITNCYFRGANGSIAVLDITSRDSFDNISSWVKDYRDHNSLESAENVVIVGNKSDLTARRQVTFEEGQEIATRLGARYIEVSAKTGQGVEDIFIEVARVIMNNSKLDTLVPKRPMNFSARGTSLDPEKAEQPKKKSGCC